MRGWLHGHGFKLSPIVGQIMAELVVDGQGRRPSTRRAAAGTLRGAGFGKNAVFVWRDGLIERSFAPAWFALASPYFATTLPPCGYRAGSPTSLCPNRVVGIDRRSPKLRDLHRRRSFALPCWAGECPRLMLSNNSRVGDDIAHVVIIEEMRRGRPAAGVSAECRSRGRVRRVLEYLHSQAGSSASAGWCPPAARQACGSSLADTSPGKVRLVVIEVQIFLFARKAVQRCDQGGDEAIPIQLFQLLHRSPPMPQALVQLPPGPIASTFSSCGEGTARNRFRKRPTYRVRGPSLQHGAVEVASGSRSGYFLARRRLSL